MAMTFGVSITAKSVLYTARKHNHEVPKLR